MIFDPPLQQAILIKRYKRFLADVRLPNGEITTIHCANTGAMTGCADVGNRIYYSTSANPKRKYPHSWEISVNSQGEHIAINTTRANTLVVEALQRQDISELTHYPEIQTEVKYGKENSRIDILLTSPSPNIPNCYIEVKSVTLLTNEQGLGCFPDAVTTRGQKHVRELIEMVEAGHRAILFFAVLHTGIEKVDIAHHIDENYSYLVQQALNKGVEIMCYKAHISAEKMQLEQAIPFINEAYSRQ